MKVECTHENMKINMLNHVNKYDEQLTSEQ